MGKIITANTLVSKHVRRQDRVLLINPPVEETRYSWLRWNQPLDLLKLASYLHSHIECKVELLDYMHNLTPRDMCGRSGFPGTDGTIPSKGNDILCVGLGNLTASSLSGFQQSARMTL